MATKTYIVAEGMSFTAMGHIFTAGETIPESVFAEKSYFAKMVSEGKIVEVGTKTTAEPEAKSENPAEEKVESTGSKKSTSKGGK